LLRFILALFFCVSLQAQEVINLKGRILNDTIEKASLTVVNISLRKGAITNTAGEFAIPARKNDTIHISAVQYESKEFVVSETMFIRGKTSFYLIPKITALDEVLLNNRLLSGLLDKDANHDILQHDLEVIKKADGKGLFPDLPQKTIEERRLHTATTGTGEIDIHFVSLAQIPLSGLINRISGKTKKIKKHLEVSQEINQLEKIKSYFPDAFFIDELRIPKDSIVDFIDFLLYTHNLNVADFPDKLVLIELMQEKATLYLALKRIESSQKFEQGND